MAYLSLDIPPGVVRSGSQVESNGRWRDANLIRWHQSRLRPVGGWFAETAAMTGAPKRYHHMEHKQWVCSNVYWY